MHDHSTNILGNIQTWDWTIYDPYNLQTDTTANPVHTFQSEGQYPIHLVLTTDHGCMDSIDKNVHIRFAPEVGFTHTDVCVGNTVYFHDTSYTVPQASIYTWTWDFGNGDTLYSPSPYISANQLRKGMNILKRLSTLSVNDLHKLQTTILSEIQRRKELSANGGQDGNLGRHSAPVSQPAPTAAWPLMSRRAA